MNPFRTQMASPFQFMMNIAKQAKSAQQNPGMIADLLKERGAIDQHMYEQIRTMRPAQIGEYLMQNGVLDRGKAQELYRNVPNISNMI